jgi:hypothetical protein
MRAKQWPSHRGIPDDIQLDVAYHRARSMTSEVRMPHHNRSSALQNSHIDERQGGGAVQRGAGFGGADMASNIVIVG